jgi:hypothetical protein
VDDHEIEAVIAIAWSAVLFFSHLYYDEHAEASNSPFIYQMIAVNYQNDSCQLHYPKRERYYISSLCFEMARQMTLSTELS